MRKIKEIISNALSHFSSLCRKVDEGTASGEESLAFGCLYVIVTCIVTGGYVSGGVGGGV